jgi:hypothetical protein
VFLIPLGCETTNSKATFVFSDIKSISLGVNTNDSITGRTLACASIGVRLNIRNKIVNADLILILDSFGNPQL